MKEFCDKCKGPLMEEGNELVCGICGAVYELNPYFAKEYIVNESSRKKTFFEKISVDKFREISNKLADSVSGDYGNMVVALSNGQYWTRYNETQVEYVGQCSVERWFNVKKVKLFLGSVNDKFAVGITKDGELQTTMVEVEQVFEHIKELGISDMRMKQVCGVSFECDPNSTERDKRQEYFVGLDVNGRVVIHNPYAVFNTEHSDQKRLKQILQEIRTWPEMQCLEYEPGRHDGSWCLYGVTKDGEPKYTGWDQIPKISAPAWEDIVQFDMIGYPESKVWIGLKKDGTVITEKSKTNTWGNDIDFSFLKEVVQFKKLDEYGEKIVFLLKNGNVVFLKKGEKTIVNAEAVAIVDKGFVFADGSIHILYGGDPKYVQIPEIKLFENIEAIEEEWAAIPELYKQRKMELEEQLLEANSLLEKMQQEVKSLENQKSSLGLFKGKEKKILMEQIQEIQAKMDSQEQLISDVEAQIPDGKAVWRYIKPKLNYKPSPAQQLAELKEMANSTNTSKKDKSVFKSAAVGALIAGPAGAVVGAIYAADKNQRNRK